MNDLKFACRQLLKNPGFTAVAVLTVALGMGMNVSIFSIFNAAAFRPLPGVKAPGELVYTTQPGQIWYPQYEFYREHSKSFSALAASASAKFQFGDADPTADGATPQKLFLRIVAGDYFGLLGAPAPAAGRYFLREEYEEVAGPPVIVLSHRFWQNTLRENPSVLGQTIRLDDEEFTIVGIAPESFRGSEPLTKFMEPTRGRVDDAPDAWSPLSSRNSRLALNRGAYGFRLLGRFKPGVSLEQAQSELQVLEEQRAQISGEQSHFYRPPRVRLVAGFTRIPPLTSKGEWRGVGTIAAVLGLVLLIACANMANLLLARAADRQCEIGIRQALGASSGRLLRQLLTESVLVALLGGMAAVLLGHWTMAIGRDFAIWRFPEYRSYIESLDFGVDWRVVAYAFGLALFSGIIFGLAPALDLLRSNLAPALKQEGSPLGTRLPRSSLRNALIVGQVAVSLCLTITAGLMTRSVQGASSGQLGFALRDVLLVELGLQGYSPKRAQAFYRDIIERFSALPGVESVGLTSIPKGGERTTSIIIDGGAPQRFNLGFAGVNRFSSAYLDTLKIPILHGRNFNERDESPVAIISASMAQRYWPGESAIGKHFRLGTNAADWEVIGITKDAMPDHLRHSMPGGQASWFYSAFAGDLYLPFPPDSPDLAVASLVVRVSGKPNRMVPLLTREVRALDRNATISTPALGEMMDASLAPFVAGGLAASALGILASLLAAMGIYGVTAYVVNRRTHEVGVRMALGARKTDVLKMMVAQGMRVVIVGIIIGVLAACGLARLLASKLFGLSPLDPISFFGLSLLFVVVALLACCLPARRAMKVDPMVALRYE
jgi:predicted permease